MLRSRFPVGGTIGSLAGLVNSLRKTRHCRTEGLEMGVESDPENPPLHGAAIAKRHNQDEEFGLGLRTPRWNVVVTARSGYRRKLRRGLAPLLRLRRSAYPNVLTGLHEDPQVLLDSLNSLLAEKPYLQAPISRLMIVERTFSVDPPTFAQQLEAEIDSLIQHLAGKTFHVRLERRGHKGRIHSKDCEVGLGGHIFERLASQGFRPVVTFADPDVIVVVEIIDDRAGIRLLTREDRTRYPFLKTD
jgi:tRNA(Ser,Leu) C12 N-acetylase TAN1